MTASQKFLLWDQHRVEAELPEAAPAPRPDVHQNGRANIQTQIDAVSSRPYRTRERVETDRMTRALANGSATFGQRLRFDAARKC